MDYIEDRGGTSHLPSLLAWGGDGMSERGRRTIPERFGVPTYGLYGAVEAFHIGFECGAHRGFHVNTDIHPVRLVDDDGGEVPEGASGQVVVSNLVSRGTVVLNYKLGDVARWIPGSCPCGRLLPTLSYVEGRVDDWLELPSGELLHPQGLRELFTPEDEHVRRYQVEQRSPSDYLVRLVSAPGHKAGREQLQIGKTIYPFLPVDTFMMDRFDSKRHIAKVEAPILILHGEKDTVIPVEHGRALFHAAPKPKELAVVEAAGHSNIYQYGAFAALQRFIEKHHSAAAAREPVGGG
jgi:hypothetical protein